MTPAKQWIDGVPYYEHYDENVDDWSEDYVKQIQLDAYKAGMTRAAEMALAKLQRDRIQPRSSDASAYDLIIAARDTLKELPT